MPDLDRFMKRQTRSTIYIAARYLYGQPLDDVRRVALLGSHAAQLVEVPEWRLLLVRTGPPEDHPFYEVVADGTWLVYDQETGKLAAWDDDEFEDEFHPVDGHKTAATQPDAELIAQAEYRPADVGDDTEVTVGFAEQYGELAVEWVQSFLEGQGVELTKAQRQKAAELLTRHLREAARG